MGLAKRVTESVEALTIGIGAGVHCNGQVLVVNDMLGMDEGYSPRHSKIYVDLNTAVSDAVQR
jgi:3-methyl-2-oxobutanoate hydroxymethyltransferase